MFRCAVIKVEIIGVVVIVGPPLSVLTDVCGCSVPTGDRAVITIVTTVRTRSRSRTSAVE